jgi:hypothetical protein
MRSKRRFAASLVVLVTLQTPRVFAEVPVAAAVATAENIRLDGRLDEPAWQRAVPIGTLIQVIPKEGEAPTEKTEVRMLYDGGAIYFGITCFDRTPSAIISTQLTRDAELDVDDHVMIVLDPFFDQRNGFFFAVNPAGARTDGQISNNTEHPNYDWDGIWNASARITPEGWEAEMAVPFKTLRYRPGQTTWGLNIQRQVKRRNETDRWAGARRDIWIMNLAEAGHLKDLPVMQQGKGLDIRPYGLVRTENGEWKADGGIDVSKNLAPNLNASLTVNTDFAETEVDARQVNLTRFPLFYPEKRPFFLEGAGVFETAGTNPFHPDLLPFFSRRIGLYEGEDEGDAREVPIIAGGKVTGRQSRYNIGFLDLQTDKVREVNLASQNLLAGRVSRDFWRQSYVGAIFTRGNPEGLGDNSLVGADAHLATSNFRGNKNLSLDLFLFRTDDQASNKTDYAGGFKIDYPNDRWDTALSWKQIGADFQPALGFVPRRGIRKTNGGVEFRPRPERLGIRQFAFEVRPLLVTNLDNVIESWGVETTPLGIEFESGDQVRFNLTPEFERLEEPFEISPGITIPIGSYRWTRYGGEIETATKRFWVIALNFGEGSFYSGTRSQIDLGLTLKPNRHLAFQLRSERNEVSLREGDFYTQLVSLRADYNFSPNVSWQNLVQYDNESRILGFQSRFRWILQPGNDLFLVINRGWFRTFDRDFQSSYDKGTVKLAYTFRF